ncbi:hypothetical protein ACIRS1_05595 [Kitasatospora sp. NPDC101176]|uniref:hypothetical protein n=1 Tax=Kitasatospora sp. NPDC101176 TaxID=3364099 RepID=UPI003820A2C0
MEAIRNDTLRPEQFAFLASAGIHPATLDLSQALPKSVGHLTAQRPELVPVFDAFITALEGQDPSTDFVAGWKYVRDYERSYRAWFKEADGVSGLTKAFTEVFSAEYLRRVKESYTEQEQKEGFDTYRAWLKVLDTRVLPPFAYMAAALRTYLDQSPTSGLDIMKAAYPDGRHLETYRRRLAALVVAHEQMDGVLDAMAGLAAYERFGELQGKEYFAKFVRTLARARSALERLLEDIAACADAHAAAMAYTDESGGWEAMELVLAQSSAQCVVRANETGRLFADTVDACHTWAREKANLINQAQRSGHLDHEVAGFIAHTANTVADLGIKAGACQHQLGPIAWAFTAVGLVKAGATKAWELSNDWGVTVSMIVEAAGKDLNIGLTHVNASTADGGRRVRSVIGTAADTVKYESYAGEVVKAADTAAQHLHRAGLADYAGKVVQGMEQATHTSHVLQIPGVSQALSVPAAAREFSKLVYEVVDVVDPADTAAVENVQEVVRACLGPLFLYDFTSMIDTVEPLGSEGSTLMVRFADPLTGDQRTGWLDGFMNFVDESEGLGAVALWALEAARQAEQAGTADSVFPSDASPVAWDRMMFTGAEQDGVRMTFTYTGTVRFARCPDFPVDDVELRIEFDSGQHAYLGWTCGDPWAEDRVAFLREAALELEGHTLADPELPDNPLTEDPGSHRFVLDPDNPVTVRLRANSTEVNDVSWEAFNAYLEEWNEWVGKGYIDTFV